MGFNYSVNFQAYKGHKTYQTILPVFFYDNDKFYIEGDDAGYYLFKDDKINYASMDTMMATHMIQVVNFIY